MKRLLPMLVLIAICILGCKSTPPPPIQDAPHLVPGVRLTDHILHSTILHRDMHVRVIEPIAPPKHPPAILILLHGAGQDYRDWSNHSDIASFALPDRILVMPDEPDSYYINEATNPNHRYEDYLVNELLPNIHRLYPAAATDTRATALIGISRGGYGAAVIGLKHPEIFGFVGILSGALDFPERSFRYRAPLDSIALEKVFGPKGSDTRKQNNPYLLAAKGNPDLAPYLFVACGDQDPLLEPNQRFAKLLAAHHLRYEYHPLKGGHNWGTWSTALPALEAAFDQHRGGFSKEDTK